MRKTRLKYILVNLNGSIKKIEIILVLIHFLKINKIGVDFYV